MIPKPPPPQIDLSALDKQNNNVIATSHLKSPSGNKINENRDPNYVSLL